jgi:hypothetical protein
LLVSLLEHTAKASRALAAPSTAPANARNAAVLGVNCSSGSSNPHEALLLPGIDAHEYRFLR